MRLAPWSTVAGGGAGLLDHLSELAQKGVAYVVVDAIADIDFELIARACRHMPVLTGGSTAAMPQPTLELKSHRGCPGPTVNRTATGSH